MTQKSYHAFWEQAARTPESALLAVDGSADESILQATGRWTAAQVAQALLLQPDDQVLELGCGVGRIVLSNQRPPAAFWHELQAHAAAPEVEPYRQYFLGLWKTRQDEWGAPPQ